MKAPTTANIPPLTPILTAAFPDGAAVVSVADALLVVLLALELPLVALALLVALPLVEVPVAVAVALPVNALAALDPRLVTDADAEPVDAKVEETVLGDEMANWPL